MSNGIEPAQSPERKRIAVFLDGTWNTLDDNTNVWRLKALCAQRGTDGIRQVGYYSRGVGTTVGEKVRGGVLGVGIDRNVARAYEWLVETYEPGDEIFIFGFSRGAYTARSLAGFIALCGVLKPGAPLGTSQLFDRYRRGDERRTVRWLLARAGDGTLTDASPEERWMATYAMPVSVKMVGVWDTVGSLGVPTTSPGLARIPGLSRSGYAFLHTGLRLPIENGYHALAIDEHRAAFAPTLWTKKFREGVPLTEMAPPRPVANVEQRWFVGAHANVAADTGTTSSASSRSGGSWRRRPAMDWRSAQTSSSNRVCWRCARGTATASSRGVCTATSPSRSTARSARRRRSRKANATRSSTRRSMRRCSSAGARIGATGLRISKPGGSATRWSPAR